MQPHGYQTSWTSTYRVSEGWNRANPMLEPDSAATIRLVYLISRVGNEWFDGGRFEAPPLEDSSIESGCRRIATGALLAQTFFRETVGQTFRLELHPDTGEPIVHRFVLDRHDRDQLCQLTSVQLWNSVADQLMNSSLGSSRCKYVAFCSFSRFRLDHNRPRWNPTAQVDGYVSQGASGLALLSTHCLYTWPECLADAEWRFRDRRPVPLMDDSNHRGTRAGCFATTLGAMIHEMGHTFNLGHRNRGIMAREFNQVDQFFLQETNETADRWWTREDLIILKANPWLQGAVETVSSEKKFRIHRGILLHSTYGLHLVEYRNLETKLAMETDVMDGTDNDIHIYKFRHRNCKVFVLDHRGNTGLFLL